MSVTCQRASSDLMWKTITNRNILPVSYTHLDVYKRQVFVIPVEEELDLKKAAKAANEKSIEMLKSKELLPLTGYVHGGCSPIGMKKVFTTFLHSTAKEQEHIIFSAGKIGYQVEVAPEDLAKVVRFTFADVIK